MSVRPKSSQKNENVKTFISGGLAGSLAKTLVAPIDRVKILVQAHSIHYEGVGIFEAFYQVYHKEGFLSLYKGNGAQILRIFPYAAFQFTSYELYKRILANFRLEHSNNRFLAQNDFLANLACGSAAGVTAVTVTYPLDMIRSRLAFQFTGQHMYHGIIDCVKKIYREKGSLNSFYRGYSITIIGMIPYAGLSFSIFERFKQLAINRQIKGLAVSYKDNKYELTVLGKLICGGLTGVLAQTVTYPLDVVRRHMQLAIMVHADNEKRQAMGIYQTLVYVYRKYGFYSGFYRGISLNYLRAIPMVSTSFCTYELSKKYLGLDTSLVKV